MRTENGPAVRGREAKLGSTGEGTKPDLLKKGSDPNTIAMRDTGTEDSRLSGMAIEECMAVGRLGS